MADRNPVALEIALQRLVTVYILTGLIFLLLPGTFLGVWNLVSISGRHALGALSPAWIQAHGHAQIFGWIGTFIIGIGYYSLSKMGGLAPAAPARGWVTWALWTGGVALRWLANITEWNWRVLLPASAAMQLAGFLIFFATVGRHKPRPAAAAPPRIESWMKLVMASTVAFLLALVMNLALAAQVAIGGIDPAVPHGADQRYLVLAAWGFPVLSVWGFNARWLPVFLGLRAPAGDALMGALGVSGAGIMAALLGRFTAATVLLLAASVLATYALRVFAPSEKLPKTLGVTAAFPHFVRGAYVWLLIAASIGVAASRLDTTGGIWGASRHALTVGFFGTMVFAIGQRVLPAFCGMRILYSKRLMFWGLLILNIGCMLRVASEIPAYEFDLRVAWAVLPISAIAELTAVGLFALNLGTTLALPPPTPAVTIQVR